MSTDLDITTRRPATVEFLLEHADNPISDTAKELGLSVEEVAVRYSRMFEDRDWMSALMKEQLLIIRLEDMLNDAQKQFKDAESVTEYATMMRAVLAGMKLVADRFDARKRLGETDMQKLSKYQSKMISAAITKAMDMSAADISEEYDNVDPIRVNEIFNNNLPLAVKEIENAEQ